MTFFSICCFFSQTAEIPVIIKQQYNKYRNLALHITKNKISGENIYRRNRNDTYCKY